MHPVVRSYDASRDAQDLRRCFIALQDHERGIYPDAPAGEAIAEAYLAWMFERVAKHAGRVLVATADGVFAGFATVLSRVSRSDPDDPEEAHALLSELSVLPQFRAQGMGRALMAAAEQFARTTGARVLRITVVAGNAGARRLYASLGFEETHVLLQKHLGNNGNR